MAIAPIILAAAMAATNTVPHTIPAPDAPLGRTERIEQDLSDMRGVILDLQAQLDSIRMADVREAFIKPDRSWEDGVYIGEKDTFENLGSDDVKVGVDSSATPDYIGATSSTGAIHTDGSITKTSSGNFVTLSVNGTYVGTNITYDCDAIETCIGTPWDVYATNHTDLLFTGSGAIGTGKSGGNTDHDDSYWHAVADGSGGSHTNYTDGKSYATTGTVAVGTLIATDVTATNLTFRESLTGPGVNAWDAEDFYVDVTAFVDIESDSDMSILSYGGNLTAGVATGTGYAYLGSSAGNLMFYAGSNTIFNDVTCATEADGTNDLFSKGFFVNEDTWSIQSITYLDPTDGSTNTIKVLAK